MWPSRFGEPGHHGRVDRVGLGCLCESPHLRQQGMDAYRFPAVQPIFVVLLLPPPAEQRHPAEAGGENWKGVWNGSGKFSDCQNTQLMPPELATPDLIVRLRAIIAELRCRKPADGMTVLISSPTVDYSVHLNNLLPIQLIVERDWRTHLEGGDVARSCGPPGTPHLGRSSSIGLDR